MSRWQRTKKGYFACLGRASFLGQGCALRDNDTQLETKPKPLDLGTLCSCGSINGVLYVCMYMYVHNLPFLMNP